MAGWRFTATIQPPPPTPSHTNHTQNTTHHTHILLQLATLAKSVGVKRFIHVSALGADETSPVRWLRTKAKARVWLFVWRVVVG